MIPILTTDYFTKPDPVGSISPTVARIMAQAGAALGDRVEKAQQQLEARALAPIITEGYGNAYKKIAEGDMSGFQDLMKVKGLGAANPLLASLTKDADQLGVHIANNVTQQAVLKDRLQSSATMQTERINSQGALQEDRQSAAAAEKVRAENAKIAARNQQRIAAAQDESKLTGKQVQPQGMEPLLPEPSSSSALPTGGAVTTTPGANPMGLPEPQQVQQVSGQADPVNPGPDITQNDVSTDDIATDPKFQQAKQTLDDAQKGYNQAKKSGNRVLMASYTQKMTQAGKDMDAIQASLQSPPLPTGGANAPAAPAPQRSGMDMQKFIQDDAISAIMNKHGLTADDLTTVSGGPSGVSLTRAGKDKITLSPEDSQTFFDKVPHQNAPPTEAVQTANPQPATVAGKKVDKVQFGNVTFEIGAPSEEEQMKLKEQIIKTPSGSKTFASSEFPANPKDDPMKSRTAFIESIGTMKTDPNAAAFVSEHLNDKGHGGVTFPTDGIVYAKDGKTILSAQMYGVGEGGKLVPYNPTPKLDAKGKPTDQTQAGTVSGEFVKAYGDALKVMDTVGSKYGISHTREEQPKQANPWDNLDDPDVKKAVIDAKAEMAAGRITREEAKNRILQAQAKKEELNLADTKYGTIQEADKAIADENTGKNSPKVKTQLNDLQAQLKDVEAKLDTKKEATFLTRLAAGGLSARNGGDYVEPGLPLSATRRKELIIIRSNLLKKIKELQ